MNQGRETTKPIEHNDFLQLPVEEVAKIVRASGTKVCVIPLNGTRRWFQIEHANSKGSYVELISQECIRVYRMLFDYGISSIVAPIFSGEILKRGMEYMDKVASTSMARLTHGPEFTGFYEQYDVRVHFYGDYRKEFQNIGYANITEQFDQCTAETAEHNTHSLFFGVFGRDATQSIAELAIQYYKDCHQVPSRADLVKMYYGEVLEEANIFIGFGKFRVFDYPLLNLGRESLYFTLAPSLFMSESLLREILYDHMYHRNPSQPNYSTMAQEDIKAMEGFYKANLARALGIGELRGGIWYSK